MNERKVYLCTLCRRSHDRKSRALACQNTHLGQKPYECAGVCGNLSWLVYVQSHLLNTYFMDMLVLQPTHLRSFFVGILPQSESAPENVIVGTPPGNPEVVILICLVMRKY